MNEKTITVTDPGQDIQHLLDSLPEDNASYRILLPPGTFRQRLVIRRPQTVLEGAGQNLSTVCSAQGGFELQPDGRKLGTFRTATVMVDADDVTLRNLHISNEAVPRETKGQAIALYADGDRLTVEQCRLSSFQDTLFTAPLPEKEVEPHGFAGPKEYAPRRPTRQQYKNCRIEGDIDFIFGGAAAWFQDCDLIILDGRQKRDLPFEAYICAPSTPSGQRLGYVFTDCRIDSPEAPDGTVYLGRPWRECAQAVFLRCRLGPCIHPLAISEWGNRCAQGQVFFAMADCAGPGVPQESLFLHSLTDEKLSVYTDEFLTEFFTALDWPS